MNIQGLDYNSHRPAIVMTEYGRGIQQMVEAAIAEPDRRLRLAAARQIVEAMATRVPPMPHTEQTQHKLWDHLYIISGGRLDVDWPYDIASASAMAEPPHKVPLPKTQPQPRTRQYGKLLDAAFDRLRTMDPGPERNALTARVANQMRQDLAEHGHGSIDGERIADDLARLTDGRIQLDYKNFRFERIIASPVEGKSKKKKKKKY